MSKLEKELQEIDHRRKALRELNEAHIAAINASNQASEQRHKEAYGQPSQEQAPTEPWKPLTPQQLYEARVTGSDAWERHLEETTKQWS